MIRVKGVNLRDSYTIYGYSGGKTVEIVTINGAGNREEVIKELETKEAAKEFFEKIEGKEIVIQNRAGRGVRV